MSESPSKKRKVCVSAQEQFLRDYLAQELAALVLEYSELTTQPQYGSHVILSESVFKIENHHNIPWLNALFDTEGALIDAEDDKRWQRFRQPTLLLMGRHSLGSTTSKMWSFYVGSPHALRHNEPMICLGLMVPNQPPLWIVAWNTNDAKYDFRVHKPTDNLNLSKPTNYLNLSQNTMFDYGCWVHFSYNLTSISALRVSVSYLPTPVGNDNDKKDDKDDDDKKKQEYTSRWLDLSPFLPSGWCLQNAKPCVGAFECQKKCEISFIDHLNNYNIPPTAKSKNSHM